VPLAAIQMNLHHVNFSAENVAFVIDRESIALS
jgi:molybdate-binding protein